MGIPDEMDGSSAGGSRCPDRVAVRIPGYEEMVMQFHDAEIVVCAWGVGSIGVEVMTYNDPHDLWNLLRAERDNG